MSSVPFDLAAMIDAHHGEILDLHAQHVNPAYAKVLRTIGFDVQYVRGEGAYLFDAKGNRYIDCLGGYAVFALGRNHPGIRDALKQAMDLDMPSLPGVGTFRLSGLLAKELLEIAPGDFGKVYFASGGGEAIDAAIKMARIATGRTGLVYCKRSYHGLTVGALSITGNHEFRDGFGPLMPATTEIPFNDLAELERALSKRDIAAFVVEPIQGKGVNIPDANYLRRASELCRKFGTLMIADEIQVGLGRTGTWFCVEHFGAGPRDKGGLWQPDIVVVAKALSGGYCPVSAVISTDAVHQAVFSSMADCSKIQNTFSMSDLSMAAGLATLHYMREERILERTKSVGDRLMQGLRGMIGKHQMVRDVRGKGLMIAVEFARPDSLALRMGWDMLHKLDESLFCQAILMPLMSDHRILAQVAGHRLDVIKLIPPLVLSEQDADEIVAALDATVRACHSFPGPAWQVGKKLAAAAIGPSRG